MRNDNKTNLTPEPRSSVKVVKQRIVGTEAQAPEEDFLAIEDPLEIVLRFQRDGQFVEKKLVVTMRTPGDDFALIHGFLYCEGIIHSLGDVDDIRFTGTKLHAAPTTATVTLKNGLEPNEQCRERNFAMHSSCGVCGTTEIDHLSIPKSLRIMDEVIIDAQLIHSLPDRMQTEQATFQKTGGLHASALFNRRGELIVSCEDIGRHNALDKAIGGQLLDNQLPARGHVLCVSGRMSYEIIQKALIARLPIIAGVGAPSSLAVALANDFNLTLIGFVRNGSYNVYSCPERILTT
ncbi:MAG: formate dehydrogenase accessory sulfurtransferase FdhD [Opitutaceae bacterium]